jgi:DNA-binding LytR/AlgR family response regulator
VVFVTAYEEHAVDAFELKAEDYLLKPVRPERLAEAIRRVCVSADVTEPAQGDPGTIPVELGGVTRFVASTDVRFVEAQGDYARLHTAAGSHLVRISLATLEERWAAAGFVRVHRSHLVAVKHIDELRIESGRCVVRIGETELPVSRRHTRELRDLLVRRARKGRGE